MRSGKKIFVGFLLYVALLGFLRFRTTEGSPAVTAGAPAQPSPASLTVGYLPVTCHLTCPVTDYASKTTQSGTRFRSRVFTDFPTVVSALQSKQVQATFMIVPLAMKLREEGVPVKICYLGHRDGSEIIVAKNNPARSLRDLKGKKLAVPSFYSNQYLVLHKLMEDQGLEPGDITFIILPPPDMPTSLASGAIDGYFVGEPFCAKAELDGIGRVLYYAKDIWPNFISCALVVHEDLLNSQPRVVADLIRGIAASGKWAETNRAEAARLMAAYNHQDQELLNYVLTSQPQRVSYLQLTPTNEDLQQIEDRALQMGLLKQRVLSGLLDRNLIPQTIPDIRLQFNPDKNNESH